MPASNYVKSGIIDFWLRNQLVSQPTLCYVALYATAPTGSDTGIEISGGGYARQPVTFSSTVIDGNYGVTQNTNIINFPQLTANVGTATYIALRDAETGGNLIAYAQLPASLQLNAGYQPYISVGDLRVQVN